MSKRRKQTKTDFVSDLLRGAAGAVEAFSKLPSFEPDEDEDDDDEGAPPERRSQREPIDVTPVDPPTDKEMAAALRKVRLRAAKYLGVTIGLPANAVGEINVDVAQRQLEGEVKIVAFSMMWSGFVTNVEDAEEAAMIAVLTFHGEKEYPE